MSSPPRLYLSPPETSQRDRQLLLDAFDSNWIAPLGPHVDAFEREFAEVVGAPYAVAVSSGTAALHLSLLAAGVGPGDRVITPSLTFVATANAVRHAGATPIFVDSAPDTWSIDPALVSRAAEQLAAEGRPAKAVLPVDLLGQCADYDALQEICRNHNMALIADAAESLGATYRGRSAGLSADFGCFSFNGNKIITTSGGGMVVTACRDGAERVRKLATQARLPGVQYLHDEVGYNYRLSNLLAALGRGQLEQLAERVKRRRAIHQCYRHALDGLPGLSFMSEAEYGDASHWLTCILINERAAGCDAEAIRLALEGENIEARPLWKPVHLQEAYHAPIVQAEPAPRPSVSEQLWRRGLCLPSGSTLTERDQQRVIAIVEQLVRSGSRVAA